MDCQVIINTESGRAEQLNVKKILGRYTNSNDNVTVSYCNSVKDWTDNANKVIVCGGDGTLYSALNRYALNSKQLIYVACGTLNENACCKHSIKDVAMINDNRAFGYVMATGVFTSIGYDCDVGQKKKFKKLAYWKKALMSYTIKPLDICVTTEQWQWHKSTSLLMLLRSDRCFGFRFNKMYREGSTYILLISAKGKNQCELRATTFPKLVKCFIAGFDKPHFGNDIIFAPVERVKIELPDNCDFCVDGEKVTLSRSVYVTNRHLKNEVTIDYNCLD